MSDSPTVTEGYLHGAGHKFPLSLESPSWKEWLHRHKRFHLVSGKNQVSVYKSNGYWVAQKRIEGKLRQKRLGNTQKLACTPWEALAQIVEQVTIHIDKYC